MHFMAVYLQERCSAEKIPREVILPSAQMLLLHFIYGGAQELSTSQAAKDLELTPTSISRASRQLEENGIAAYQKKSVCRGSCNLRISEKHCSKKAGDKLLNPIKTNGLYSERIAGNRAVGKWIFGVGRVFYAEHTECQMLCGRKESLNGKML